MGIQGLLPFLKKIHQPVNISDFKGCTVAVDAYCWLHKGAFSCAEKLAMGEKTEQYVYYCMKYVDYLLRKGLKPILVFDGCHLKSKADVEKTRRGRRELNRKKAAQFLREGKRNEAKECLQKCVDITPQMALDLMNVCRDRGVDCIVAPYEADAQLAYLNLSGVAQLVVTEDSDLLLFGCDKVIFKMDFFGNGILIEKSQLNQVLAIQNSFYSFEKFRYMCILSGCDYLPSLPGIGLVKACKVLKTARQQELRLMLKKLPTYLKMNLVVPDEYVDKFICANNTFLYQLVFDPLQRKMIPLHPYPPDVDSSQLDYAGQYMPEEKAYQIALGNVDIHSHKCIAFFDPATFKPKTNERPQYRHQLSIWDPEYRVKPIGSPCKTIQASAAGERPWQTSHSKARTVHLNLPLKSTIKPEIMQNPGKLDGAEERLLMSQYEDRQENPQDGDDTLESSQKENVTNDCFSSDDINPENQLVEEETEQESRSSARSPKKGKKRKAPTWLEETAIEASHEELACAETQSTESSPAKSRNVFAVSPAKKSGRFNLEVHALRVKSRYFGSTPNPGEAKAVTASPDPKPFVSSNEESLPSSSASKTPTLTSPKNRLLSMFENAPVRTKKERDEGEDLRKKDLPKLGLHKYFYAKSSQTVEQPSSLGNNGVGGKAHQVKTEPVSAPVSLQLPNKLSQNRNSMKSKLSAFSWSKCGPMARHLVTSPASQPTKHKESVGEDIRHQWAEDESRNLSDGSDCLKRLTEEDTKRSVSEESGEILTMKRGLADKDNQNGFHGTRSSVEEDIERSLSTKRSPEEDNEKSLSSKTSPEEVNEKSLSSKRSPEEDSERSLSTDSGVDEEVMELQSCSYSQYLQSLEDTSSVSDSNQQKAALNFHGLESPATGIREDSSRDGNKVTANQDWSPVVSQRSSLGSIDSFCVDNSQPVVVDLTDSETDSQSTETSQTSTVSRHSSFPSASSKCRVSGLSRLSKTKVKKSATKPLPGQPSITDMISKYW